MANEEHIRLLKMGVEQWNQWRRQHPEIRPDLSRANLNEAKLNGIDFSRADISDADLSHAKLNNVNFSNANLSRANLSNAELFNANLSEANLSEADFIDAKLFNAYLIAAKLNNANLNNAYLGGANLLNADLITANLRGARLFNANLSRANFLNANFLNADLSEANLSGADLRAANLSGADLRAANLSEANLSGTDLKEATMQGTILNDLDLRTVKGLEQVLHRGPSGISTSTLERSQGSIPDAFLRGAGLSDTFIAYVRSLVSKPIEYYTCFISYSSIDQPFAERLYADLQVKGVRCWYAPEDLKIGDKFWHRIDESIRLYDKLLVVLSQHSLQSDWVEREVMAAFDKEVERKADVLFPVRLDETVMQTNMVWAADLRRRRHIGDFTHWKDHDAYRQSFARLVRDLNKPSSSKA